MTTASFAREEPGRLMEELFEGTSREYSFVGGAGLLSLLRIEAEDGVCVTPGLTGVEEADWFDIESCWIEDDTAETGDVVVACIPPKPVPAPNRAGWERGSRASSFCWTSV